MMRTKVSNKTALFCVLAFVSAAVPHAAAADELVMPYSCRMSGGRPTLIPGQQQGLPISGPREQRRVTICSPADPNRCRAWTVHRFNVLCDGVEVPWPALVAGSPQAHGGREAWLANGRLRTAMPPAWNLPAQDPCAQLMDDPRGGNDPNLARYCSSRGDTGGQAFVEMPAGFAPLFGIDAAFVQGPQQSAQQGPQPGQQLPPVGQGGSYGGYGATGNQTRNDPAMVARAPDGNLAWRASPVPPPATGSEYTGDSSAPAATKRKPATASTAPAPLPSPNVALKPALPADQPAAVKPAPVTPVERPVAAVPYSAPAATEPKAAAAAPTPAAPPPAVKPPEKPAAKPAELGNKAADLTVATDAAKHSSPAAVPPAATTTSAAPVTPPAAAPPAPSLAAAPQPAQPPVTAAANAPAESATIPPSSSTQAAASSAREGQYSRPEKLPANGSDLKTGIAISAAVAATLSLAAFFFLRRRNSGSDEDETGGSYAYTAQPSLGAPAAPAFDPGTRRNQHDWPSFGSGLSPGNASPEGRREPGFDAAVVHALGDRLEPELPAFDAPEAYQTSAHQEPPAAPREHRGHILHHTADDTIGDLTSHDLPSLQPEPEQAAHLATAGPPPLPPATPQPANIVPSPARAPVQSAYAADRSSYAENQDWPDEMPATLDDAFFILGMGVTANTSPSAIKRIVDGLRQSWHPDGAAGDADRSLREQRSRQINAAWDIISDSIAPQTAVARTGKAPAHYDPSI